MNRIGVMVNEVAFANLPIIFKNAGYDFMILDCEHGSFDFMQTASMIMVAKLIKLPVIVRIAQCLRKDVTRYMDMGADGILLAMTSSPEQIAEVIRYAKYAPIGKRGISTMRAHTLYNPPPLQTYMKIANENTFMYAQIETLEGVKKAAEIAEIDGVDGVLFGPNDYSCDAGKIGDAKSIYAAIREVAQKVTFCGKRAGIITGNKNYLSVAADSGMTMFSVSSELSLLSEAADINLRTNREYLNVEKITREN